MVERRRFLALAAGALALPVAPVAWGVAGRRLEAGPQDYRRVLRGLRPGDQLRLRPGVYRHGLPLHRVEGLPGAPITVSGPAAEGEAVFQARAGAHSVSLLDCAHVTVRNLRLEGGGVPVDGVRAEGHGRYAHHVTLEGLAIRGHGASQQNVGISTKCPAWGWVVRGCRIEGAGTGMYFGDSDGSAPFVGGRIECNLVLDTRGYNLQVKHQTARPELPGMPRGARRTVIRHNTFAKERGASAEMPRPNVLVGHWPVEGPGSDDLYLVHGNLFYANPTERLFQGEGNVAFVDNVLVNLEGDGLAIQPHNDVPRRIWILHNTVVARDTGLWLATTEQLETLAVTGNAIFAGQPANGTPPPALSDALNFLSDLDTAAAQLRGPLAPRRALDAAPRDGRLGAAGHLAADLAGLPFSVPGEGWPPRGYGARQEIRGGRALCR
jgi:hypothetical protein